MHLPSASIRKPVSPDSTRRGDRRARLQASTHVVSAAALAMLEHGAFGVLILEPTLRVLYASALAQRLLRGHTALTIRRGYLIVTEPRLAKFLAARVASSECPSLALQDRHVQAEKLILSRPLSRRASDPIVLQIFAPRAPRHVPTETLRDVYQLTPAETTIVEYLVNGHSVAETAVLLDLSPHTVRTHAKRILTKCAVRSQSDLIRIVLSGPCWQRPPLRHNA